MSEILMSVPEVADELRITEEAVRRMLRRGALAGVKAGKEWRIPKSELKPTRAGDRRCDESANQGRPRLVLAIPDTGDMDIEIRWPDGRLTNTTCSEIAEKVGAVNIL